MTDKERIAWLEHELAATRFREEALAAAYTNLFFPKEKWVIPA